MVGHGGSSAGSYLADPTSPIPSHCALIVATSTSLSVINHRGHQHFFLHCMPIRYFPINIFKKSTPYKHQSGKHQKHITSITEKTLND